MAKTKKEQTQSESVETFLQTYPNALVITIGKKSQKITQKEIRAAILLHEKAILNDIKKNFPAGL